MSMYGASKFPRVRHGYEPTAVDEFIWQENHTKQSLIQDNQSLQYQLSQARTEIDALKTEIATLYDTSSSAPALTQRITKLLHTTLEEVSAMRNEAQTEATALISAAKAQADTLITDAQIKASQLVTTAQAEADTMRADAQTAAARCLQHAEREAEEVTRQQIATLHQLAAVHRNLANVPTALESVYQRKNKPPTPPTHPDAAPTTTEEGPGAARARHTNNDTPPSSTDPLTIAPTPTPNPTPARPNRTLFTSGAAQPHAEEILNADSPRQTNGHRPPTPTPRTSDY